MEPLVPEETSRKEGARGDGCIKRGSPVVHRGLLLWDNEV